MYTAWSWTKQYTDHYVYLCRLIFPGTDHVLADLKMYTDLSTHYLRGMMVLKNDFWTKWGKTFLNKIVLKIVLQNYHPPVKRSMYILRSASTRSMLGTIRRHLHNSLCTWYSNFRVKKYLAAVPHKIITVIYITNSIVTIIKKLNNTFASK